MTAISLFGYEPDHIPLHHANYGGTSDHMSYTTERVVIPDTSEFLKPALEIGSTLGGLKPSPVISFPKYNNYLKDDSKFDLNTKFLVPLSLLGIKPLDIGKYFNIFAHNKIYKCVWIIFRGIDN